MAGGAEQDQPRFQRTREALKGGGVPPMEEPRASLAGVADRIREMLVTAEGLAEAIRREATEEAARYLAERRQEADALLAAARQEADALLASRRQHLEEALTTLRSEGREIERRMGDLTATLERVLELPEEAQVSLPEPETAPVPEPEAEAEAEAETGPDSVTPPAPVAAVEAADPAPEARAPDLGHQRQRALIRATQLAVQGADRRAVRETLDREFDLEDSSSVVDEILGSD